VGGVVARTGGQPWLDQLSGALQRALPPTLAHEIPVVPATFGQDSVAVGGLALAHASLSD
jgi:hypothetical protein